jgi:hypothetical protein
MTRAVLVLHSQIEKTRATFAGPKRTLPQNERMWAMLTDVARQVKWHGQKLSPDDWKVVFLSALKAELRMVPNLDGNGFVQLGRSSSALSVDEMSDLMALIEAFGAREGVTFGGEEAA